MSNQPTYFMALKDGAGLVKGFAMIDIQRYQNVAVRADTVADTQKAYEALLATNGVVAEGEGGATDVVTVKGTIRSMNQAVIEGNTHFYLTVEGEDGSIFDFALPGLLDIVGYKVGDEINFTYVEAAGSNVRPAYEILGEGRQGLGWNPGAPPARPRTMWCRITGPPRRLPTLLLARTPRKWPRGASEPT